MAGSKGDVLGGVRCGLVRVGVDGGANPGTGIWLGTAPVAGSGVADTRVAATAAARACDRRSCCRRMSSTARAKDVSDVIKAATFAADWLGLAWAARVINRAAALRPCPVSDGGGIALNCSRPGRVSRSAAAFSQPGP